MAAPEPRVRAKLFLLIEKHAELDDATFRERWRREAITALSAADAPPVRQILLNNVIEHDFRPGTNAHGHRWSGVAEFYFDDAAAVLAAIGHPALSPSPDLAGNHSFMPVDETLMYDHLDRIDPVKVFGFFKMSLPVSREASRRQWGLHADLALELKADSMVRKYSQNATFLDHHNPVSRYDYDGASIVWFNSVADAESIYKNADFMEQMSVDEHLMGNVPGDCVYLRTDEARIYGDPR